MVKISLEDRFWNKVDKTPYGITDSCWIWNGSYKSKYGQFKLGNNNTQAHRASFIFTNNRFDLTRWEYVCHHCDNPGCVNPNHLFIGTHQENMDDMVKKERQVRGSAVHCAKLSDNDVRAIRVELLIDTKWGNRVRIGTKFGVCQSMISLIALDKKWKHVN